MQPLHCRKNERFVQKTDTQQATSAVLHMPPTKENDSYKLVQNAKLPNKNRDGRERNIRRTLTKETRQHLKMAEIASKKVCSEGG